MRILALIVWIALVAPASVQVQSPAPRLWAGLTPGAYPVGFGSLVELDATRQLDGKPRPVQISCWFPAASGTGTSATFRDYFVLSAGERGAASTAAEQAAVAEEKTFFASAGVPGALVDRWLDQPVYARAAAPPAGGPFPLILVAQGNGQSAHHQAVLSEFLASHGFIVCTTPSQARLGTVMQSEADVLPSAMAQAADLAVAERHARAHFRIRGGPAALVGHSFGARSALLRAARDGAVSLVSLDGGIGAAEGRSWVEGAAIDRERFVSPILHIYEEGDRAITPNFDLLRSLNRAQRTLVRIEALRHVDFTSLGFGAAAVEGLTGPSTASLDVKLRAIGAMTLRFIEAAQAGLPFSTTPMPWIHVETLGAK